MKQELEGRYVQAVAVARDELSKRGDSDLLSSRRFGSEDEVLVNVRCGAGCRLGRIYNTSEGFLFVADATRNVTGRKGGWIGPDGWPDVLLLTDWLPDSVEVIPSGGRLVESTNPELFCEKCRPVWEWSRAELREAAALAAYDGSPRPLRLGPPQTPSR